MWLNVTQKKFASKQNVWMSIIMIEDYLKICSWLGCSWLGCCWLGCGSLCCIWLCKIATFEKSEKIKEYFGNNSWNNFKKMFSWFVLLCCHMHCAFIVLHIVVSAFKSKVHWLIYETIQKRMTVSFSSHTISDVISVRYTFVAWWRIF